MKVLPESKVTIPLAVNVAVGLVLQLLQTYVHGFHAPPAAVVAGIVTVVTFAAGWLAPHTSRGVAAGLSDAERRRAENLRLMHDPGSPSVYPYPGEPGSPPARPPAASAP